MLLFPHKINNDVTLNIPQDICCNCGQGDRLAMLQTPLTVVRYMVLAGTQITIPLELPYCDGCAKSAKRKPVGLIKKLLLSAVLAFVLAMLVIVSPDVGIPDFIRSNLFYFSAGVALIVVFGVYSLFKPREGQSSYYQPVRLRKLKQKFTGRITGFRLAFTNELYAQKVIAANPEALSSGALEVATLR
jgi:hypothetical protein